MQQFGKQNRQKSPEGHDVAGQIPKKQRLAGLKKKKRDRAGRKQAKCPERLEASIENLSKV